MATTLLLNGTIVSTSLKMEGYALFIDSDGKIGEMFPMEHLPYKSFPSTTRKIDVKGGYIAPGFIDTHLHGIGGFGTEDYESASILGMSERLADFGVTAFFPTIYTDTRDNMIAATRAVSSAIGHEKGAKILGIHLEGPFLSLEKKGAQNPAGIVDVDIALFDQLLEAGEGHVVCMTVAPEIDKIAQLALHAHNKGVLLLAGHSDATYEEALEGMGLGILHTTHCFNGMEPIHHRNIGLAGAALLEKEIHCEIIADGAHVSPPMVRLLLKNKEPSKVVLITDSLKPAALTEGPFIINGEEAILGKGNAFYMAKKPDLMMGSSLTMLEGVKNLVSWGSTVEDAVAMGSTTPAKVYSLEGVGSLSPGYTADIAVFDEEFNLKGTFVNGQLIRDNF